MHVTGPGRNAALEMFEGLGVALALLDSGSRVVEANKSFLRLVPLVRERPDLDLLDLLNRTAHSVSKIYGGVVSVFELDTSAGKRLFRLDTVEGPAGRAALLRNVSDQVKYLSRALKFGAQRKSLLDEVKVKIWTFDPEKELVAITADVMIDGDASTDIRTLDETVVNFRADDRVRFVEMLRDVSKTGEAKKSEVHIRQTNGRWLTLSLHMRGGEKLDSGLYEVYGATLDVTPQAEARDIADRNAERLSIALQHAHALAFEYDYDLDDYIWFHEGADHLPSLQLYKPEAKPSQAVHPDDKKLLSTLSAAARSGERPKPVDIRWYTEDKGYIWVRLFYERVQDKDGKPGRGIGVIFEIDEQKRQELELEKTRAAAETAAAAKSNFLASMSHEIRTPLNGVLGMAQVLSTTALDAGQRDLVNTIVDSGNTLMALLNDVLDLSKIEAGKFSISPTDGDLLHTIEKTLSLFRPLAQEKGLDLKFNAPNDLPRWLVYDSVRVRQCLSNLLSNAVKFTERGRVDVTVSSREVAGEIEIRIEIADTGIGMSEETLRGLFNPFTQADGSISRKFGGTGLGLAITQKLAALMKGEATAASCLGQGSTFLFTFRATRQTRAGRLDKLRAGGATAAGEAQMGSMRARRILLVDDNAINRRVVALFLAPSGPDIVEAENGVEALEKLAAEPFDIVLLDIHMPVMDGSETIKHIRASGQTWSGIPVVALTADAMSGDKERYLAQGMSEYVSKPIDQRELVSKITALLAASAGAEPASGQISAAAPVEPAFEADAPAVSGDDLESLFDEIARAAATKASR